MALMERVTTLLRANLNDLVDKAEDPEKLLKQLVLDMENQLLQVKTQVAIAIADQHLLERKRAEHETAVAAWKEKAAFAVARGRDDMAREALDRAISHTEMTASFAQQLEDQRAEAEALRGTFLKLQQKLTETRNRCDLLLTEHRRTRAVGRAHQAHAGVAALNTSSTVARSQARLSDEQASSNASRILADADSLEDRFQRLERSQQVEALLEELKSEKALPA